MSSRRYVGRHRAPISPNVGRGAAIAALTATGIAAGAALPSLAHADPPGGWGPIIACESGGNPTAHNPSSSASGLFQFLTSSWLGYGGGRFAPTAAQATPAQQLDIANHAFALSGLAPWAASRSCWAGKSAPAPTFTAAPEAAATPAKPSWQAAAAAYTVRAGDTLSTIAARHRTSWQQMWQANRGTVTNANMIFPGERLVLP